jgi:segregation and condensation protein B
VQLAQEQTVARDHDLFGRRAALAHGAVVQEAEAVISEDEEQRARRERARVLHDGVRALLLDGRELVEGVRRAPQALFDEVELVDVAGPDADAPDDLGGAIADRVCLAVVVDRAGQGDGASGERVELATATEAGALIARYVGADAPKLSTPSLETLAIVAYRQPCTRATIERIRGVDSDYTLRTLMHRRLVVELGRSEAPGRPILFGTGFDFLERFGLTSLEGLPLLEPDVAERLFSEPEDGGGAAGR